MKTIKIKAWDETKQEWVDEIVTIGNAQRSNTRLDHLERARKEFGVWLTNRHQENARGSEHFNESKIILATFQELF